MDLSRNTKLITNICLVQIKSVHGVADVSAFQDIYSTPSKIILRIATRNTDDGVLHNKNLSLSYPGLSSDDFQNFESLTGDQFQILYKLHNNDIYQLSSEHQPLNLNVNYSNNHTLIFTGSSFLPVKYRANQPNDGINIDGFNYDLNFFLS